jgi:hypothetical protein
MYSVTAKLIATGKNIVNDRRRSFSVILIARAGSSAAKETAEREGGARPLRLGSMCVVWEPRRKRPTTEGYNGELDVYMNIKDARFRIATALKYGLTSRVSPIGWRITLPAESPLVIEDAEEDVRTRILPLQIR